MNEEPLHHSAVFPERSFGLTVFRGIRLRCPACGHGRLFRNLFQMYDSCSVCGFRLERSSGYFLGSTYINYGVTALTTTVSFVVMRFGLGWDRHVLLPGLLLFCLIFPLVFFRFARSLWLSLDCYFDRVGASEAMAGSRESDTRKEVTNNED
jgi:uncharacterized protein (DUF983 family)